MAAKVRIAYPRDCKVVGTEPVIMYVYVFPKNASIKDPTVDDPNVTVTRPTSLMRARVILCMRTD